MAAITTIALGVAAAAGTATQVAGAIGANKRSKEAKKAIESYERQNLVNYAALQAPSVKGEEIRAQEVARTSATQMAQAGKLGSRGIGIASNIAERTDLEMQKIAASMDSKRDEYKRMAAQGAMNIQAMQENREAQDLAGLGQAYNVARQERAGYMTGAAQGLMGMTSMAADIWGPQDAQATASAPLTNNANQLSSGSAEQTQQFMSNTGFSYEDNIMDSINDNDPTYKYL